MARIGWWPLIGPLMLAAAHRAEAVGDPETGARLFRACAACHSLAPREQRTGRPVLIPASMMGDRAFVIFAAPEEISGFIESKC